MARGLVGALLERVSSLDLPHAALVAVQDSRRFWEGQGFAAGRPGQGSTQALASYPGGAVYMTRASDRPTPA